MKGNREGSELGSRISPITDTLRAISSQGDYPIIKSNEKTHGGIMERINERKALRTRFMNELFEIADGSRTTVVKTSEIAKRLGLVFEWGRDNGEVLAIVNHLEGEGLIEATEEGGDVR